MSPGVQVNLPLILAKQDNAGLRHCDSGVLCLLVMFVPTNISYDGHWYEQQQQVHHSTNTGWAYLSALKCIKTDYNPVERTPISLTYSTGQEAVLLEQADVG